MKKRSSLFAIKFATDDCITNIHMTKRTYS